MGEKNGGDNGFRIHESSNKLRYQNGKLQEDYLSESKVPSKNRKRCQNGKVEGDYLFENGTKMSKKEGGAMKATFFSHSKSKGIIFQKVSRASNASMKESKTVPG
jgi:hypothetical protein